MPRGNITSRLERLAIKEEQKKAKEEKKNEKIACAAADPRHQDKASKPNKGPYSAAKGKGQHKAIIYNSPPEDNGSEDCVYVYEITKPKTSGGQPSYGRLLTNILALPGILQLEIYGNIAPHLLTALKKRVPGVQRTLQERECSVHKQMQRQRRYQLVALLFNMYTTDDVDRVLGKQWRTNYDSDKERAANALGKLHDDAAVITGTLLSTFASKEGSPHSEGLFDVIIILTRTLNANPGTEDDIVGLQGLRLLSRLSLKRRRSIIYWLRALGDKMWKVEDPKVPRTFDKQHLGVLEGSQLFTFVPLPYVLSVLARMVDAARNRDTEMANPFLHSYLFPRESVCAHEGYHRGL